MELMKTDLTWHIEKRKISDLKAYHKNPRYLTKDQETELLVSIDNFGLIDKPFINLDNTIIGGHQRIQILKKLEHTEIEVNVPNRALEEWEVEELNIRHNKNTGDWDYDILANQFEVEDLLDWGFTEGELGGISVIKENADIEKGKEGEDAKKCPMCNQKMKE